MIVEYEQDTGRITHIVNDPVPPGLASVLQSHNRTFLSLPPIPWEPEPAVDPSTGEPVLDEWGDPVLVSKGYDSVQCDFDRDYIVNGEITPRPEIAVEVSKTTIVADDQDEAVISGLPDPVEVLIDGETHIIEGGSLVITSPMPATYKVEIHQWPYLPWSVEITANET